MRKFHIGIRFEPLGQNTTNEISETSETDILQCHWALVVTPVDTPEWSLRVELGTENDVISFPSTLVEADLYAHPLGIWTGYLDDVLKMMELHPMRGRSYSVVHNNCQHWAATLLVFLEALARSGIGRRLDIEIGAQYDRYTRVLAVLNIEGNSLYHAPNSKFARVHLASVGGAAAAAGASAMAAEATVLVPASGIMGWFGATVAVPTAGAVLASAIYPFTMGAAAIVGGTYLYKHYSWKSATKFDDPRKLGCPTDGRPLSNFEKGQGGAQQGSFMGSLSRSSGLDSLRSPWSSVLLGSYIGVNAGTLLAAFSPGAAAIYAPLAAASLTSGTLRLGRRYS
ncbi:hypothetical protein DL96DRAFT_1632090 [Flagelloscypha sp. PMI_526]|nr:hypothetical protein DL96DRAFT_1632090 [Flagelloscypha sp. PMI_526]